MSRQDWKNLSKDSVIILQSSEDLSRSLMSQHAHFRPKYTAIFQQQQNNDDNILICLFAHIKSATDADNYKNQNLPAAVRSVHCSALKNQKDSFTQGAANRHLGVGRSTDVCDDIKALIKKYVKIVIFANIRRCISE